MGGAQATSEGGAGSTNILARSPRRSRFGRRPLRYGLTVGFALAILLIATVGPSPSVAPPRAADARAPAPGPASPSATPSAVTNFTTSINRLVELLAVAGGGILALVWARVAFSWFSNDISKKVQAKDRARDALIGTLVFTAAITGLVWGLAQWVLTGA